MPTHPQLGVVPPGRPGAGLVMEVPHMRKVEGPGVITEWTELRRLVVAHQKGDVCPTCDRRFETIKEEVEQIVYRRLNAFRGE